MKEICEKIFAMHTIMKNLNDEDILMSWLEEGIPDGTETLEDVLDLYEGMEEIELVEEYKNLQFLFGKLVRWATEDGCCNWIC
jgi:hypothetical protein